MCWPMIIMLCYWSLLMHSYNILTKRYSFCFRVWIFNHVVNIIKQRVNIILYFTCTVNTQFFFFFKYTYVLFVIWVTSIVYRTLYSYRCTYSFRMARLLPFTSTATARWRTPCSERRLIQNVQRFSGVLRVINLHQNFILFYFVKNAPRDVLIKRILRKQVKYQVLFVYFVLVTETKTRKIN